MRQNAALVKEFAEEARSHIAAMEAGLLALEGDDHGEETVNEIFRAVHSIKGTAGLFSFTNIVDLSHALETLFGAVRDKTVVLNEVILDAVLAAVDTLKAMIDDLEASDGYDIGGHVGTLKAFVPAPAEKSAGGDPLWDLWNEVIQNEAAAAAPAPGENNAPAEDIAPPGGAPPPASPAPPAPPAPAVADKAAEAGEHKGAKDESIRVNVAVLNDLLNLAGEMVLKRNQLLRLVENGSGRMEDIQTVAGGIDLVTTALQEKIMKARMQPIATLFNRFPRVIRELSRKLNKEVVLRTEGINVELDKSIIEALSDPLTHIIRNAIDHGIEARDVRESLGKHEGNILLRASHEAGRVTIEISDDGAGIDIARVAAKAVQKGLVSEKELAVLGEREILQFIMRPGFSTAESVSEISGRGVGMDVVRTNIEKLGGKIEIITELGAGTTFRLMLPLTLAIIPALIVRAGEFTAAIPQANLHELVLIQPEESRRKIEFVHGQPVLRLRNRLIPVIRLAEVLDITGARAEAAGSADYFRDAARTFRIIALKCGSQKFCVEVDNIFDHEEILVKPLPPGLNGCDFYMGSTVLGDGRIAMIVDPEELKPRMNIDIDIRELITPQEEAANAGGDEQEILLFKSAGGETLGVDLTIISRVVKIAEADIQKVRSKEYIVFQGKPLRILRPEYYLPIARPRRRPETLYVIIPKIVKQPVGIVASEICDSVKTVVELDTERIGGQGIIGSVLLDNKIVLLVNIYEIFEKAMPDVYQRRRAKKDDAPGYPPADAVTGQVRVLFVEDTPFFAKVTKSYLEDAGYEVLTAGDGRQALDILQGTNVDLVISDIEMPVMNGFELIRAIRADARLKDLPVIALTALVGEARKEKGLRAGFDIYEYKLDRIRLLESIRLLLNNRKQIV